MKLKSQGPIYVRIGNNPSTTKHGKFLSEVTMLIQDLDITVQSVWNINILEFPYMK